ncbi:chromosome condensation protein, putative [Plasmodium gallinaceum]|uniref:Condensin complex subunit 2 n=1 Tax=Plasmodium gallinaceum TaxID=5849 RepID=A0A1J1GXZ2_PLAGA|nr:chromosome condensation protein, putative [Plasmodium gallinaceum]CRG97428.1 chromosome condensation protein, putative [Plasmodium gallinaceum]
MKKLGISSNLDTNLNRLKENETILKKPIEINKNIRRLSFLNNKSNESKNEQLNKFDKTKVKEINDVFKNCMVALSHNKICTRNAFDIRIIDHLEDLVNLNDEEISDELNDELLENGDFNLSFTRASKAIEGATKVYGYRVEAIYDQTYNFLSNMNIAKQNEINEELQDEKKNVSENSTKKMKKRKLEFLQESSTLAKSSDITIDSLSLSNISVDTFFLKLNSLYDHSSGQSYLLPNLILNNDLSIQFDGDIDACEYKKRKKIEEINSEVLNDNKEEKENILSTDAEENIHDNNDNLLMKHYKKKLYLNTNKIRDILLNNGEDFNNLSICPELEYFKEEINKHKLKKLDSKGEENEEGEGDEGNNNENEEEEEEEDEKKINMKMVEDYGENFKNSLSNNMTMDNLCDDNNNNMEDNKILSSSNNNFNNQEYKIEDLNIENVMQESMAFDNINLNNSVSNNLNFSQSMLSFHQSSNLNGILPEMMKSENRDFSIMNMNTLNNFNLNSQNVLFKHQQSGTPTKKSMISSIPDEDTLWNRSIMTFENRLNAIDVNNQFNYQYYIPSKIMVNGNFRNLMDITKNTYKNKTVLVNGIPHKRVKTSFNISSIDFENLHIEINDIELSTYDLWKKEKKKYISNVLFSVDQTSYIFETKDNCINCVNTVTDKIMKFSKLPVIASDEDNTDIKLNIVLNEINNDFITNDIDQINFTESKNMQSLYAENIEEIQESQIQEGLNDAIDKFYNMDFEDIWQNENDNENNQEKQNTQINDTSIIQFNQSFSHANSLGNMNIENISKFVDVSKIKQILCDIVKPNEQENTNNLEQKEEKNDKIVVYNEEKTTTFTNIIKETKFKLNDSEVNSMSIHMLFVCLLYTCNDQELLLEKIPNEEDFYVRYGLPVEFHIKPNDSLMLKN